MTDTSQKAFEAWWAIHHEDVTNCADAFNAGWQAGKAQQVEVPAWVPIQKHPNESSREAFESWCKLSGHSTSPDHEDKLLYWYAETSAAWDAWQASRAEQAVEPVAVFDIAVTEKMAVIDYDCTKHNLKSGDKLYNRPTPPAQQVAVPDVELRNLAAKLRTIWANPQDNVFIYRAADMLDKQLQQVAVPKVTVELPDGDDREVKTWFTEMRNGELWVAISVEAQQVVPEGYALVPIEPTPMMLSAFHAAVNVWMKEIGEDADIYKAMLTAAQGAKP